MSLTNEEIAPLEAIFGLAMHEFFYGKASETSLKQVAALCAQAREANELQEALKASDHWLKESLKYIDAADRECVRKQLVLNGRVFAAAEKGVRCED